MAIGKKTGGRDFVKGQSGNPNGRPKKTKEEKERDQYLRDLRDEINEGKTETANLFIKDLKKNYNRSKEELKDALKSEDLSTGERIFITFLLKCMKHGGVAQMGLLMRMMSADEMRVDISSKDGSMSPPDSTLTEEQLTAVAEAFVKSKSIK